MICASLEVHENQTSCFRRRTFPGPGGVWIEINTAVSLRLARATAGARTRLSGFAFLADQAMSLRVVLK